jgi:hypothetical protein
LIDVGRLASPMQSTRMRILEAFLPIHCFDNGFTKHEHVRTIITL